MLTRWILAAALVGACRDKGDDTETPADDTAAQDLDGDGYATPQDCDDRDNDVYPGAPEVCNGEDDDCDGVIDLDADTAQVWWLDTDGDGWGGPYSQEACAQPEGFVADDGDCDDADATIHPDTAWYADADSDGYGDPGQEIRQCEQPEGYVLDHTDCEDGDAAINPESVWYTDADGDGFGDPEQPVVACNQPSGTVADDTDCDDTRASYNPDATWYLDHDGDGYGDGRYAVSACEPPFGYGPDASDCDDFDAAINPDTTWYLDGDGDGYGDPGASVVRCAGPSGFVLDANDCDDGDATLNPETPWYQDSDSDGWGDSSTRLQQCAQPGGYVRDDGDCDDSDPAYSPGATPGCDGEDYDCDGLVDNDADGDGYAASTCGGDDCDDTNANVNPGNGVCPDGATCLEILNNGLSTGDGVYTIDPDGYGTGEDPIDAWCDMSTDGGGWTLCASLTKGYVPAHMLYNVDAYAFQARLNSDRDFVFERDAPARTTATWNASETLNYGQFCRLMGSGVTRTRVEQKSWNWANNSGTSARNNNYNLTRSGTFSGNLFTLWFTNSGSGRSFTHVSGDRLYVTSNNNGYGGPYVTPTVGWSSGDQSAPYTQSTNPWNGVNSSVSCTGCTDSGSGYNSLPYGQTTILNNMGHSFWSGVPNVRYGWSDCTANGNCNYHESGYGVWLFWAR